jgi:hypothetical protein
VLRTGCKRVSIYWRTRHAVERRRFVVSRLAFAALPLGGTRKRGKNIGQLVWRACGGIFKDSA